MDYDCIVLCLDKKGGVVIINLKNLQVSVENIAFLFVCVKPSLYKNTGIGHQKNNLNNSYIFDFYGMVLDDGGNLLNRNEKRVNRWLANILNIVVKYNFIINIAIVGTGYVGLVSGTCFSELGAM